MKFSVILEHLSSSSTLVLLPVGVLQWKRLEGNLRLIVWVIGVSVLADAVSLFLISKSINTWPVGNLFIIVHFALLFVVLGDRRDIVLLRVVFVGCLAFGIFNYFFLQTPKTFNSYTTYATGILMIISALNYLYYLMDEMPSENIQRVPLFWLAFGVLVYYGGTLFLFLFTNYMIVHLPKIHQNSWVLHNVLNITKNVFLFATIWVNYRSKTSPL